ncbi:MAG TPA: hypothetical protein VHL77_04110, partial [Ferruginibacter sp.]|nr:hypothetical protein [Ferruginibacter sp.]
MKIFGSICALAAFIILSVGGSTTLTSCKKTITKHDTTVVHLHDTTIVKDTVCDCNSGLVAYYMFKNGSLGDSSGYSNHITANNNAVATTDHNGVANGAYQFNGTNAFMQVPDASSLNPTNITLFAIVKVNGFYMGQCGGNQIVGKGYPDNVQGWYNIRFNDFTTNCSGSPQTDKERFYGSFGNNNPQGSAAAAADTS